jgi:UDP-glucose 4-epimerase
MRALVTGGAGFIGHHLARRLLDDGHEVAVIDDLSTGRRDRVDALSDRIDLVIGDICDAAALDRAVEGVEVIYHQAAIPSVARSLEDPRRSNEVNTSGTIEVMLAAKRAGVRRVVYAGSSSVYGDAPTLPRRESQMPAPRSPYATSKLAGEHYLHSLGSILGIETVALRYFNIFGPGQDPLSQYAAVVPRFITAALNGIRPDVYGDGRQSRDFTHVDNAVAANLLAANTEGASGGTFNIGCGGRYDLLELIASIEAAAGVTLEPRFGPPRAGDVPHSQADISLAQSKLGYEVVVPFGEGIRRTVESFRTSGVA